MEQLGTWSDPHRHPSEWQVVTAYLGLVAADLDPALPGDTSWRPVDALPELAFDHGAIILTAASGCAPSSPTRTSASPSPPPTFTISELRDIYVAALGHPVSATNLQRVLVRRGELVPTGDRRAPGAVGGRPAAEFTLPGPRPRGDRPVRGAAASASGASGRGVRRPVSRAARR